MIDEYYIISILRYLNALDKKRSIGLNELAFFLKKETPLVYEVLSKMSQDRKIFFLDGQVWLTTKGFFMCLRDYS
jgi:hypothetical protein